MSDDFEMHGFAWTWFGDHWRIEEDVDYHGIPMPSRERPAPVATRTMDERRELKIAEGDCPLPGCYARLDDDFYCSGCGNVSLPAAVEPEPSVAPCRGEAAQAELPHDEFGPAQVEAA